MTVTGRAAALALAGVLIVLAFRDWLAVVALAVLLGAGIGIDLLLAAPVGPLVLTRSGDRVVRLGASQPAEVTLTIVNPGPRTLRALVRDAWPPSAGARYPDAASSHAVTVPRAGLARTRTLLTPTRRGDRTSTGVTIRSGGPLGLAARQRTRPAPWTVRVLPSFASRRHLPAKLSRLRELDGMHRSLIRGQGSEFDSLRDYVPGDDVRSIDWRGTARRQSVMVRTWRPERNRPVLIVLDTGRTSAGRVGDAPRLDTSMDAALLLTALVVRAGDRLDLLAIDQRVRARVVSPARSDALRAVTDALAPLDAELTEPDGALMATAILGLARQRALVVLLTDLNPSALSRIPLPAIAARHTLLIGAVADPRLDELAAGRGDAARVYAAAAAERARAERAELAARLRRQGILVVDAPPGKLPPALADAYLDLKAAGRL